MYFIIFYVISTLQIKLKVSTYLCFYKKMEGDVYLA